MPFQPEPFAAGYDSIKPRTDGSAAFTPPPTATLPLGQDGPAGPADPCTGPASVHWLPVQTHAWPLTTRLVAGAEKLLKVLVLTDLLRRIIALPRARLLA